jgi:hypothetical protein
MLYVEFDQAAAIDAILEGVSHEVSADAGEESNNYLDHSVAHRAIKRMAVENPGFFPSLADMPFDCP